MLSKKQRQGLDTRARLIRVARDTFLKKGFVNATTQEIIDKAKVTKGALYHHFPSKNHLFEAVYRDVESEMAGRIQAASRARRDPFEQLVAGCFTYLETCADSELHRILRLDGPAALGQRKWSEIDREYGAEKLLPFIEHLCATDVLSIPSAEAFTFQLTGAMNEATFWISHHTDTQKALRLSKRVLRQLLEAARKNQA